MSDRYIVKFVARSGQETLAEAINYCPPNHRLHSVVPTASTLPMTDGFVIIFERREFGSEG